MASLCLRVSIESILNVQNQIEKLNEIDQYLYGMTDF